MLALTRWAMGQGAELEGLNVVQPSLEDAYLRITEEATAGDGSPGHQAARRSGVRATVLQ